MSVLFEGKIKQAGEFLRAPCVNEMTEVLQITSQGTMLEVPSVIVSALWAFMFHISSDERFFGFELISVAGV